MSPSFLAPLLALLAAAPTGAPGDPDEQYRFLTGLCEKGHFELAVEEARAFLRDFPRHAKADLARYRLALACYELERFDDAAGVLAELERVPGFEYAAEASFRRGQCELARERYDAAVAAFERVLAGDAAYLTDSALFLAAEAHFRAGEPARAEARYTELLERERADGEGDADGTEPEHARDAEYALCWCAFQRSDHARVVERVRRFLTEHPRDPLAGELSLLAGESLLELGRPREALDAFDAVPDGPHRAAARRGAGFARAGLGDPLAAARAFAELLDHHPDSRFAAEAALHLGIQLLEAGEAENALRAFELPQAVPDAELRYWKARALAATGEGEHALDELEAALRAEPEPELAERIHLARGDLLFELGRPEEAARAYAESDSDYSLHAAAVASFNAGRYDEAAALARRLLAAHPDGEYAARTRLTLGEALFAAGDLAAAEEAFSAALAAPDGTDLAARGLSRLGWCAFRTERHGEAAERFGRLAREHPEHELAAEALYMEARARLAAGDRERARDGFARYLERFPDGALAPRAGLELGRLAPGDAGLAALEDVAARFPASEEAPAALFELAERLSERGDTDAALGRYRALLERYPQSDRAAPARYGAAWTAYAAGRFDDAADGLAVLLGARDAPDELVLAALELSLFCCRELGRPDEALAAWSAFEARAVDEGRLLRVARVCARTLEDADRGDAARALYDALLARLRTPEAARAAHVESVFVALDGGRPDDARGHLEAALAGGSADAAVLEAAYFVGEASFDGGDHAEAAALYELAAAEASPLADRALYKQGFAHLRRGAPEDAARSFRRLVDAHAESELFGEALYLLGEAHWRAGAFEAALAPLERLLEAEPSHAVAPKALFRLGLARGELGRWAASERALAELARRFPDFENGLEGELARGRALAALERPREARQAFERVVARDDGQLAARARLGIGGLAQDAGDFDAALSEFLKVALLYAHDEEVAEATYRAGEALWELGDRERAVRQWREVVASHPDARFAKTARERLEQAGP